MKIQGKAPIPDNYRIVDNGSGLVGLMYIGKKGNESVLSPVCSDIACFQCMGKTLLAYSSPLLGAGYSINNKKSTIKVEMPVLDFFAGTTYLYVLSYNEYNQLEWAKLKTDLTVERWVGQFTINDYALKDGSRILSGTNRMGLDILDRNGKTARITFKTGVLEDIITFSKSSNTVKGEKETVRPATFMNLEINLTNGNIRCLYDNNVCNRIANFSNIKDASGYIVKMLETLGVTFNERELVITVKQHTVTYKVLSSSKIGVAVAEKIEKIFRSFELYGDASLLAYLMIANSKEANLLDSLLKELSTGFIKLDETGYSVKVYLISGMVLVAVKNSANGKISTNIRYFNEKSFSKGFVDGLADCIGQFGNSRFKKNNVYSEMISKDSLDEMNSDRAIPVSSGARASAKISKEVINNPTFGTGYVAVITVEDCMSLDENGEHIIYGVMLRIFNELSYSHFSEKRASAGKELTHRELVSKKYNENNIVLNTTTSNNPTIIIDKGFRVGEK